MTFNGKSKATSQFFFDLKNEPPSEAYKKFMSVVEDYFSWYANFQNKEPIKEIQMFSSDFVCSEKCVLGGASPQSVVDLIISKEIVMDTLKMVAEKYDIKLDLKKV